MTFLELETLIATKEQTIPICYQSQEIENIAPSSSFKMSREVLVSLLFLIGSLMFVLDAILENMRGVSFSSLLHLSASALFTIGSMLFIPHNSQQ